VQESIRSFLSRETRRFVQGVSGLSGIERIALVGSLLTKKENPKDTDLLVTVEVDVDIDELAKLGRRLRGHCQGRGVGTDIFLCNTDGVYIGLTCSYVEGHPRMVCRGNQCHLGTKICDDFNEVRLNAKLSKEPSLELWPDIVKRIPIPVDVETYLLHETML